MKSQTKPKIPSSDPLESQFEVIFLAIYRYFRYRGADPQLADDLAATVVERALLKKETYDPRKGSFNTWIFHIAHNTAINHWTWQTRRPEIALDSLAEQSSQELLPEEFVIQHQDIDEMLSVLRILKEREREILALKFAGHLTNRQIGDLMGLSEDNIGVILHRTFQQLKFVLARPLKEVKPNV